jgi:hypothetical protein
MVIFSGKLAADRRRDASLTGLEQKQNARTSIQARHHSLAVEICTQSPSRIPFSVSDTPVHIIVHRANRLHVYAVH